jgi:hypothetical protein
MTSLHSRVPAHCRVSWRVESWSTPSTTDRWQDKGARGVLVVGCLISRGYGANAHITLLKRSLRSQRLAMDFKGLMRCAEFPS